MWFLLARHRPVQRERLTNRATGCDRNLPLCGDISDSVILPHTRGMGPAPSLIKTTNDPAPIARRTSNHTMSRETFVRESTHTQQNPARVEGTAVRRRILVVDHNDQARLAACHYLAQWGFVAVGEDNGLSGLALLAHATQDYSFDGLLLEMDMPVLGGMSVLQEMKDRHPAIPVLVMAEARHIEKLRDAVRMWAREYIVKPFDTELLKMKCAYVFTARPQKT